jgi:flagellum-specific ATP synthase
VDIPGLAAGHIVELFAGGQTSHAEVCSLTGEASQCQLLEPLPAAVVGMPAIARGCTLGSYYGPGLLGHCVDAWGRGGGQNVSVTPARSPQPLSIDERCPIATPLLTGVAAIDALCTIGKGQRVAIFSGAGVGKSTLLRQVAERTRFAAHVFALIGERGREAAETVAALREGSRWHDTVVVCATAEAPPRERFAAARTALIQAEWLASCGVDVLLTVDSLTRVANAWRELALAAGEPAVHRGHPASMIGTLASLVERAGARKTGSITGIFAVLVDGDDPFEPVTDAVRGLLDGHIVLSRRLSDTGCHPPVDVLRSSSRLFHRLTSSQQAADAGLVRKALAALERAEDLLAIGAYRPGGDLLLDAAIEQREQIEHFLHHGATANLNAVAGLHDIANDLRRRRAG